MTAPLEKPTYPWAQTSPCRANLAIGNLRENLKLKLTTEHGIRGETLLAAAGAITGFAAQKAVWKLTGKSPADIPNFVAGSPITNTSLIAIKTKSGETLFFGDALNSFLSPVQGFHREFNLWGFVLGALYQFGLSPEAFPKPEPMYQQVSKSIGNPDFGYPHVPAKNRVTPSVPQLLRAIWPFVRNVLNIQPPDRVAQFEPPLREEWWPVIASIVARQLMLEAKGVLEPLTAAVLVMESAIVASKIDPRTVPTTLPLRST